MYKTQCGAFVLDFVEGPATVVTNTHTNKLNSQQQHISENCRQ